MTKVHQQHNHTCKYCHTEFSSKRRDATHCRPKCRKAAQRQRQNVAAKKRIYRFQTSAFGYWLADECRRAGTIEILQGHTVESMAELHTLTKRRSAVNGYGEESTYSLCHLFPVKHHTRIGVLRAENLVISYSNLNSRHSNTAVAGIGVSIPRFALNVKWMVSETATKTEVISKIVEYFGNDFVETLAVKLKLQSSIRQQVYDYLVSCGDSRVPSADKLAEMSTQQLTSLKKEITGKGTGGYLPSSGINGDDVFREELKRLAKLRPELERAILAFNDFTMWDATTSRAISHCFHTVNIHTPVYTTPEQLAHCKAVVETVEPLLEEMREQQFTLLHGGTVAEFIKFIDRYQTVVSDLLNIEKPSVADVQPLDVQPLDVQPSDVQHADVEVESDEYYFAPLPEKYRTPEPDFDIPVPF